MGGFTPLFGPGSGGPPKGPQGPGDGGGGSRPAGFTPLFGGGGEPAGGRPPGFTPLTEALGMGFGIPEAPAPPQDLDALLAAAREEGAAAARDELEPVINDLQDKLEAVAPILEAVERLRADEIRKAAEDVGELVIAVCRRVLGESLAVHPDALPALVVQAVSNLPDEDELRIRVRPDDVTRVRDALPERYEDKVAGDPTVSAGCKVESRHAAIDATLAAAVEGVENAVQQWLEMQS